MSPMTHALISYWHRLPSESPASRRKALDATRDRIRAGLETPAALVPFALGDVDDSIVIAATREYVAAAVHDTGATDDAIIEVTDWVRRGLALNRGAVFGALLLTGNADMHQRLAALRLTLSVDEVAVVCRQWPSAPAPSVLLFLRGWTGLLDGSDDPTLSRQRALLASTLDRCVTTEGQRAAA